MFGSQFEAVANFVAEHEFLAFGLGHDLEQIWAEIEFSRAEKRMEPESISPGDGPKPLKTSRHAEASIFCSSILLQGNLGLAFAALGRHQLRVAWLGILRSFPLRLANLLFFHACWWQRVSRTSFAVAHGSRGTVRRHPAGLALTNRDRIWIEIRLSRGR